MTSMDHLVLGFPECETSARDMAAAAGLAFARVELHRFPDGESLVRIPAELPPRVTMFRTLDFPNPKLVELMLAAVTCRERGARHLGLVAPYLCYMRQDIAFHPGEAVSQTIIGGWLGSLFDRVITVDPHLHRVHDLGDAVPGAEAMALSAAVPIGRFLAERRQPMLLVGPDEESEQWVRGIANVAGMPFAVARKARSGDRSVVVELPGGGDFHGASVVLVDDVASTGHTLAAAALQLRERGAEHVDCVVTHPLFCDDALEVLRGAGVEQVWSSNSIEHATNAVCLDDLLAEAAVAQAP